MKNSEELEKYKELVSDMSKSLNLLPVTGSYLDEVFKYKGVIRKHYGNDKLNKPNDHCNWEDTGYTISNFEWVENDEHFRNRLKG